MVKSEGTRGHFPWFFLIVTVIVFFFGTHTYNKPMQDLLTPIGSDLADDVAEGGIKRRLLFSFLGLVGIALTLFSKRWVLSPLSLTGLPFSLYVCWALLSVTWSIDPGLTTRRLILYADLLLFAGGLARHLSNKKFLTLVFMSTTVFLLIGIADELGSGQISPFDPSYRFAGTVHPNVQGVNCALLLLSGVVLWRLFERCRIPIAACMLCAFACLLMTRSRTSFAAIVLSFAVLFLLKSSMPRRLVFASLILIAVSLLWLFASVGNVLVDDVVLMGRHDESTQTLVGRIPVWSDSIRYAMKKPLQGYGFCTFWSGSNIEEFSSMHGWSPMSAHSVYLDVLLSVGLIGFLLFFLNVIVCVRLAFLRGYRNGSHEDIFLFLVLLFGLFHGVLESTVLFSSYAWFSTFVALSAMVRIGFNMRATRQEQWPDNRDG